MSNTHSISKLLSPNTHTYAHTCLNVLTFILLSHTFSPNLSALLFQAHVTPTYSERKFVFPNYSTSTYLTNYYELDLKHLPIPEPVTMPKVMKYHLPHSHP